MKIAKRLATTLIVVSLVLGFVGPIAPLTALAATAPALGDAASFSVLGASAMSSANTTTISGDLGLSPGLAVSKTGTWTHTGGADYFGVGGLSASAQTAALGAYNNLVAQTSSGGWGTNPWSPVPGVWTDASSPAFTGTITLDGDYSDIWVFKISTDFTFSGSVVLAGNAQACNVFWSVAGDATIGSGSNFAGTLIAQNNITSVSGATINGRLISLTGTTIAMNGSNSSITGPTCASAPTTLRVVKAVTNDDSGVAVAGDWTLTVTSSNGGSGTGSAAGEGLPGTAYTLEAGKAYSVAESGGPSGYISSASSGCTIASAVAGTAYTCTITNNDVAPGSAVLRVVKLVTGGTAVASAFNVHVKNASGTEVGGGPFPGVAGLGTAYALPAGTYTVSEDANSSYTRTFTGTACNASGVVTLAPGDDKICTIVNTSIPVVAEVVPTVSYDTVTGRIVPLIGMIKIPAPLALPAGSGPVAYDYTVWNVGGQQALIDITITDDKCGPLVLLSGDLNRDGKLNRRERWKYSCTTTLSKTTTNTAIATGYSDDGFHQASIATAVATVAVGVSLPPPLINIVKVPSRLTPFPFGGGDVIYTYIVTNPGVVAMHDVAVTDDKCAPVSRNFNDANLNGNNNNNLLEPGESWSYTCRTNVPVSTMNVATAEGKANGFTALGYAFATVLVATPGLPNTGFPLDGKSVSWGIVILSGIFMAAVAPRLRRGLWAGK